ncbi:MAG: hypothetical protein HY835_07830 [Anaerolineae bacterium]|nr:hypothetical protein [Anaerolineae bacterium]
MPITYTSRLVFANGISAENVQVRVFDRDDPGREDDDLTVEPGMTGPLGYFTLTYDASRARDTRLVKRRVPENPPFDWTLVEREYLEPDPTDKFQPYLRFDYAANGKTLSAEMPLKSSRSEYRLNTVLEQAFLPSQHGFHFVNAFSGFFLPFALPNLPGVGNPDSVYGLCGGMAASSMDFFLARRPVPTVNMPPSNGTPIQRYLYKRQLDSLGILGEVIFRFASWMGLPDDTPTGTMKRSLDEFEKMRTRLNQFCPVPIGLLYVKWKDTNQVWMNHQVLALGYSRVEANRIRIRLYDPNFPLRDDVAIEAERVPVGEGSFGLRVKQVIGTIEKKLYGFFIMPYQAVIPPEDLDS